MIILAPATFSSLLNLPKKLTIFDKEHEDKNETQIIFVLFVDDIGRSENLIWEFTQPPIKVGKKCKMHDKGKEDMPRETTKKKKNLYGMETCI